MNPEPRLIRIEPAQAPAALRPTFDAIMRDRGKVPNLFQVTGHAPRLAASVEIVAVVGLFNYFNRIANALDIPQSS